MLSAEDFAAVKVAVAICNSSELKHEIITGKGISIHQHIPGLSLPRRCECRGKIEMLVGSLGLINSLEPKVIGLVNRVAVSMRSWADYHAATVGLSHSYIANFLNISFFTSQGSIDNKKAAEEILKDEKLSTEKRYKLACLYCFKEHIRSLHRQLSARDKKKFYDCQNPRNVNQPKLFTFWTYYILGKIAKLEPVMHPYQYGLQVAVESGNKVAVEYFLEGINEEMVHFHIICDALKIIKPKLKCLEHDCYVDILYFLLLKLREDEQIEFLMEDIHDTFCDEYMYEGHRYITALHRLLCWPYQNHFMKLANQMWGILPKRVYANLLLAVCDKIDPEISFKYEAQIYDYRKLFNEYWCQSPDYYKNYVVSNEIIIGYNGKQQNLNVGKELLLKLCMLKNFTVEDGKKFEMIFRSVKEKEMISSGKEHEILSSKETGFICLQLILKNKWKTADEFLSNCFPSREKMCKFKKGLVYKATAIDHFVYFLRNDRFNEAEIFLKWSSLSEGEVRRYKREAMYDVGLKRIADLFSGGKAEIADRLIKWSFSSEEEVKQFKKEVLYSSGMRVCEKQVLQGKINLVDDFISNFLFSEEEIEEFKKHFSKTLGGRICCELITGSTLEEYAKIEEIDLFTFTTSRWKEVGVFLSWCFSSDVEINNFKQFLAVKDEMSYVSLLEVMHLILVIRNSFSDIDKLYAWFDLSPERISRLKRETILSQLGWKVLRGFYREVFFYSINWKAGEKLKQCLKWCLKDPEAVIEFKYNFDNLYGFKYASNGNKISEETRVCLKKFYEFIEKLLADLKKKSEKKRKMSRSSMEFPNKRCCRVVLRRINILDYS